MKENQTSDDLPRLPIGEDATLVVDPAAAAPALSAEELRRRLGLPDGDRLEDYGELKTIGVGGMGAVFSGSEPGLKREVALKMLRPAYRWVPERITAFIREARATAQISHPNIVPVYRIGVFEGVGVYFAMKKVRGQTLRSILAKLAGGDADARCACHTDADARSGADPGRADCGRGDPDGPERTADPGRANALLYLLSDGRQHPHL